MLLLASLGKGAVDPDSKRVASRINLRMSVFQERSECKAACPVSLASCWPAYTLSWADQSGAPSLVLPVTAARKRFATHLTLSMELLTRRVWTTLPPLSLSKQMLPGEVRRALKKGICSSSFSAAFATILSKTPSISLSSSGGDSSLDRLDKAWDTKLGVRYFSRLPPSSIPSTIRSRIRKASMVLYVVARSFARVGSTWEVQNSSRSLSSRRASTSTGMPGCLLMM